MKRGVVKTEPGGAQTINYENCDTLTDLNGDGEVTQEEWLEACSKDPNLVLSRSHIIYKGRFQ